MSQRLRFSVVIANWNYAEYLHAAVDSAFGLAWPASDVEVIVVDDGSTDDSRTVIKSYGTRVRAIYQANGGQRAACNAGFAVATGDVVIFLDADDVLEPSFAREVAAVFYPGVSKVQCQMQVIDASGEPTGSVFPSFGRGASAPTPQQVRRWALRACAYPTPPGSGNAYARTALKRIFPLEGTENASDSYCLAAAPYLGDVVTIAKPLVRYRVHGRNDGAMSTVEASRFGREVRRAEWRFHYAQGIARSTGASIPDAAFDLSLAVLPYRVASLRLAPEQHPIAGDTLIGLLGHTLRACFVPQGRSLAARAALLIWAALVALLPAAASERLVLWRFASTSRPRVVLRALAMLRMAKQ